MSNDKKTINEGYIPQKGDRGYQPSKPVPKPSGDPTFTNGYIPTTSGGDNPTNKPAPPGDE
tara:strand:+ start:671 stop:853 length:183 start_codon:yes stop_codon:yes gene_type:complete